MLILETKDCSRKGAIVSRKIWVLGRMREWKENERNKWRSGSREKNEVGRRKKWGKNRDVVGKKDMILLELGRRKLWMFDDKREC